MIAKFSCGCIGIPSITDVDGRMLILDPCDLSGDDAWEPYQMRFRDQEGKTWEPVPQEQAVKILSQLGGLLSDGYKFRRIKSLLS